MNQKIIPVVSICVGVLAFALTYKFLHDKELEIQKVKDEIRSRARTIEVIAAASDLPSGTTLRYQDLGTMQMLEASAPDQVVRKEEVNSILGKKTLFQIKARQAVLWSDIEGAEQVSRGLAPMVKPGMRAISLPISGAAAVSGMVEPNDHVDIIGTFTFPSKTTQNVMESETLTVLQDVTVLATGQDLAKNMFMRRGVGRSTSYSTVTFAVYPDEAEVLVFALHLQGKLSLTLRNPSDVFIDVSPQEIDFQKLKDKLPKMSVNRKSKTP
jgi:pilus assembly protein CpaB